MLLKDRNITAYQMIKDLALKKSTTYKCINGKSRWEPYQLLKIAGYLNVSIDYLVFGSAKKQITTKPVAKLSIINCHL